MTAPFENFDFIKVKLRLSGWSDRTLRPNKQIVQLKQAFARQRIANVKNLPAGCACEKSSQRIV